MVHGDPIFKLILGGIHVSCSIGRYTVDLGDVKAGKVTINQSFQKRTGSENFRNEIIFNPNVTCIIPRVIVFTQGKFLTRTDGLRCGRSFLTN